MANNVYIGARYVPKLDGDWSPTKEYEALTVVMYNSNSYTSKRPVPVGTLPTDTNYWMKTGDYNGNISFLQGEIDAIINELATNADIIKAGLNVSFKTTFIKPLNSYTDSLTAENNYHSLQGAAYDTRRNHYCFFIISGNGSDVIAVVTDTDLTTVITRRTIANAVLGHGNDFTYNPVIDKFVATPANGDGNKVLTIDPVTLDVVDTYTPIAPVSDTEDRLAGITYAPDLDCYFAITGNGFWKIKSDFTSDSYYASSTIDALVLLPNDAEMAVNFWNNGVAYYEGKLYVICQYKTNPRQSWMVVFNLDGTVQSVYQMQNQHINTEYEAMAAIGGVLYAFSQYQFFTKQAVIFNTKGSDNFYSPYLNMERILSGDDLNDYYAVGKYHCIDYSTVLNSPITAFTFDLDVYDGPTGLIQSATAVVNGLKTTFERVYTTSNESWSSWKRTTKNILPLTTENIVTACPGFANYQGAKIIFTIPDLHLNNTSTHPITDITATYTVHVYSDQGVYEDSGDQDITDQNSTLALANDSTGIRFTLTLPTADINIANHAVTVNIVSMTLAWS